MAHLSHELLWQRWWICSTFDPFLGLLGVWAVPSYVPFVFSMKEIILPSLPLILVFVPIPTLAISLAFGLSQGHVVLAYLCWLLPLLVASLLFYIENLLVLRLLCLWLASVSIALLGVSIVALELLALVLFF